MKSTIIQTLILATTLSVSFAHAEPPEIIVQQGRIVSNGVPLDGPTSMTFSMKSSSGETVYTETVEVQLSDGFYSVELGVDGDLGATLLRDDVAEMTVAVDGVELSPGHQMTSVPFSVVSKHLEGGSVVATNISIGSEEKEALVVVDGSGNWTGQGDTVPCDGCVASSSIQDGSVAPNDLGFSVYRDRNQLYERTITETVPGNLGRTITASCDDANDLPLSGYCPSPGLHLRYTDADWTTSGAPAEWACNYSNPLSGGQDARTTIICIDVP